MRAIYVIPMLLLLSGCWVLTEFNQSTGQSTTDISVENSTELINDKNDLINSIKTLKEFYEGKLFGNIDVACSGTPTVKICNDTSKCQYPMTCESFSMSPTFTCNDELYGYYPKSSELKVGDIIIFKNKMKEFPPNVIHRIIGLDGEKIITKGDVNDFIDNQETYYKDIRLKICRIDYK